MTSPRIMSRARARSRLAVADRELDVAPSMTSAGVAPVGLTGVAGPGRGTALSRSRSAPTAKLTPSAYRAAIVIMRGPVAATFTDGLADVEGGVDRPQARHRRDRSVHLDLLAAQEALDLAHVGLELRDRHRLALEDLHRAVAAGEREARAPAGDALDGGHGVGGEHGVAQRHRHGGAHPRAWSWRRPRAPSATYGIGEQAVRLADRQAVPAVLLHRARDAVDLGDRHGRRAHAPELGRHVSGPPVGCTGYRSGALARSSRLSTLPAALRGSASTNTTADGFLKPASRSRQWAISVVLVDAHPPRPRRPAASRPTADAASRRRPRRRRPSCSSSTRSTSAG